MGLQRGFPAPTSYIPSKSWKASPFFFFFLKMGLERVFAKKCFSPHGERDWALPSPAAIPAAAWGTPCSLHWLFILQVGTYLFCVPRVIGMLWMLAEKLNITGCHCSLNHPSDSSQYLQLVLCDDCKQDCFLGLEPKNAREGEQGNAFSWGVRFIFCMYYWYNHLYLTQSVFI